MFIAYLEVEIFEGFFESLLLFLSFFTLLLLFFLLRLFVKIKVTHIRYALYLLLYKKRKRKGKNKSLKKFKTIEAIFKTFTIFQCCLPTVSMRFFFFFFVFFFGLKRPKRPVHALTLNISKLGASQESNGDSKYVLLCNREKRICIIATSTSGCSFS